MVPQYEFEKGTWWRDGFWRYARFKNMPLLGGSHVRGGGGGGGGGSLYLVFYGTRDPSGRSGSARAETQVAPGRTLD